MQSSQLLIFNTDVVSCVQIDFDELLEDKALKFLVFLCVCVLKSFVGRS